MVGNGPKWTHGCQIRDPRGRIPMGTKFQLDHDSVKIAIPPVSPAVAMSVVHQTINHQMTSSDVFDVPVQKIDAPVQNHARIIRTDVR